jgi:hypothetical protein
MTTLIAAYLFSFYFVNFAGIPQAVKGWLKLKPHQRIKPFDCVGCLSVWTAVGLYFSPAWISELLAISFGAGCIGLFIEKLLNK